MINWKVILMKYLLVFSLIVSGAGRGSLAADEQPVSADARLKFEGKVAFVEGPSWHPTGNVYFSDIPNERIMRRDRNGEIHVFRTSSGFTNGTCFDLQGRMICCEGGGAPSKRRVTRLELDGNSTVQSPFSPTALRGSGSTRQMIAPLMRRDGFTLRTRDIAAAPVWSKSTLTAGKSKASIGSTKLEGCRAFFPTKFNAQTGSRFHRTRSFSTSLITRTISRPTIASSGVSI